MNDETEPLAVFLRLAAWLWLLFALVGFVLAFTVTNGDVSMGVGCILGAALFRCVAWYVDRPIR